MPQLKFSIFEVFGWASGATKFKFRKTVLIKNNYPEKYIENDTHTHAFFDERLVCAEI